ncbi:hypothetical protein QAD02_005266 [Eretmocerus hayati]|uniref:Uncharacterized protein n=1 Tax=Eretmocerus hayati TaxID=131215 RepID=A0ACC2NRX0_9HYME|nr:hypothetical protein QAD02_005266 [Eretmocerus hayati]
MDKKKKKKISSDVEAKNESDQEIQSRIIEGSSFAERYKNRILKYYLKKWPWVYHVLYDPTGYHRRARKAFAFSLGLSLGIFLYVLVIADLKLGKFRGAFRCICLLTIPGLFGRAGRSVLKALVLGYVIGGPIFNLTLNSKEVMRSFACTGQLTYNLTKTKYDLMFRPFKQSMVNMKQNAAMMKNTVSLVKDLVEPIQQEIEGEDPPLVLNNDTSLELPLNNETASGSGDGENLDGSGGFTSTADDATEKTNNITETTSMYTEQYVTTTEAMNSVALIKDMSPIPMKIEMEL